MNRPELEKIPEFILADGRKSLSFEVVKYIEEQIGKLKEVQGRDRPKALFNIGIMQSYINEFEKAQESFYDSCMLEHSGLAYSNYIQALERTGKYALAIEKTLSYLENNPNNKNVYFQLAHLAKKYPSLDLIEKYNYYFNYMNFSTEKEFTLFSNLYQELKDDYEQISKLNIENSYIHKLMNIAFIETKKIQVGQILIGLDFNRDLEMVIADICVENVNYSDISILNQEFDKEVFQQIKNSKNFSDNYYNNMEKFIITFRVSHSQRVAA
ncbi:hypothetical protein E0H88_12860 [Acinetobacter sp. ANC 4216]|uniref:hypothetical protein n=1 Tax=Acinetobacter sp. ANC 4216 TaxID=2529840 RepID=UPI00103C380D|nr:hypothetical protein [Acinetobacter sp. ANC 4216]TCB67412.1 hypothetical protein E0H88_12860 [Acinetobacter sp. ANC 4216]